MLLQETSAQRPPPRGRSRRSVKGSSLLVSLAVVMLSTSSVAAASILYNFEQVGTGDVLATHSRVILTHRNP